MGWAIGIERLRTFRFLRVLIVIPILLGGLLYFSQAQAAELLNRFVQLSDGRAGVTAAYTFGFGIQAPETLGSIQLQFCANSPLIGQPCTAPAGFDVSGAALSAQSGETGFVIDTIHTNANTLVLTRVPVVTTTSNSTYTLVSVTNPSAVGSFYGRLQTFASIDASGPENDHGGLAMSINNTIQVSTTVPPYLLFCTGITITGFDCNTASGNYINFGNLSNLASSSAQSQLLTATNAASGYSLQVSGATMTSGNNTISPMAARDVSRPGVGQFGMNLVGNADPSVGADPQGPGNAAPTSNYNQADFFKFLSGDTIATAAVPQDFRKFTASYILNIPTGQPVGVYVTTLTYTCLANF